MRARYRLAAGTALVALSACGGSGSGGYPSDPGGQNPPPSGQQPPPSGASAIAVKNNFYDPSSASIAPNTTVTWTWDACTDDGYGGKTCVDHSVTFDAGASSATQSEGTFSRTFTAPGTFVYRCSQHPGMSGQVVVR